MKWIIATIILTGCASADYYQSKKYKAEQRKKMSMEMFEQTHQVRKKCSPRRGRPGRIKRKRFYS